MRNETSARTAFNAALTRREVLGCSAVLTGCGSQAPEKPVRLVAAGTPAMIGYLPHLLAERLGFYKQQGVSLTVDTVAGGSRGLRSLLGGSADVVLGFFDHPVRITAQGRTARAFVGLCRCPGNVIVARANAHKLIHRLSDLRGAAVGIPDFGSQAHWFLNYALLRAGVALQEVRAVPTGLQAAGLAALERGKIDAWVNFDPGITRYLTTHPDAAVLVDTRTIQGLQGCLGVDDYPGTVLYSTPKWLERNAETARRMAGAICMALRWVREHSVEQIAEVVPASYRGHDVSLYRAALKNSLEMFSQDGRISAKAASAAQSLLAVSSETVRTAPFDLAQTYTNQFVEVR